MSGTQNTSISFASRGQQLATRGRGELAASETLQWSVIVPTYRRRDVLRLCLEHLRDADIPTGSFEVLVYDNSAPESSHDVAAEFIGSLPMRYTQNPPGHGLGYSLCRGAAEARGDWIVELNDDALVPPDIFQQLKPIFESDSSIGVIGVRAIESEYASNGDGIGVIDRATAAVVGNFHLPTDRVIDVEHVYGFCYAYRRNLLDRGGHHDATLLSRDYSSGNRIETDHCLTATRLGYRVVYDGRIAVKHLAKPRGDMSERSLKWRLNNIRNTLYFFLKHFGWFGRRGLAFRFALLHDIGILSLLRQPTVENAKYFLVGMWGRASAVGHWLVYLITPRRCRGSS